MAAPPLSLLTVTSLEEVSFVDQGDNPDAGVLLMKAKTPTPAEPAMPDGTPDATEMQKKHEAEIAKMRDELAAFQKERDISAIEKRITPHLDAALAPDLYEIGKLAPDAAKRIEAEMIRLSKSVAASQALTARIGGAPGVAKTADRLEKAITPLMATGLTRAQAIEKAMKADPSLYTDSMGS